MTSQSTIAPHILALAVFLSVMWGLYLAYTIYDYRQAKTRPVERRKGDVVAALRRMLVAFCVFSLPFSLVVRTALVLAGFGNDLIGQIVFFSLVGPNVVGSIFAVVTTIEDLPLRHR